MAHVNWHCVCVKEREKARVTVEVYECVRDVRGNWTGKKKKKKRTGRNPLDLTFLVAKNCILWYIWDILQLTLMCNNKLPILLAISLPWILSPDNLQTNPIPATSMDGHINSPIYCIQYTLSYFDKPLQPSV